MINTISIIHPSRNRPGLAETTAKKWLANAKHRNRIQYILCIDASEDPTLKTQYLTRIKADILSVKDNRTAIEAINRGAQLATGDLIVVISDDFDCLPDWDVRLTNAIGDRTDFVAKTDDGVQPWIITLPIMDRAYFQRFGYVYYPGYEHLFCDTEMTHVGDLLGKKISLPVTFTHNHYSTGRNIKDAVNEKNDRTWAQGEALYLERLRNDFGLSERQMKGFLNCDQNHLNWLKTKGIQIQPV